MTNHSGTPSTGWVEDLIRRAWPETAGVTLAALDALAAQETFTRAQVAYLIDIALRIGAHARTAGDEAELIASREARFEPRATREARISARLTAMAEQHEIAWLRRTGSLPETWAGGTAEDAMARYMWGD